MPRDHEVEFDESTSSSGPYYLEGSIVRVDGEFYRVGRTRRLKGARKSAWLEFLDTPSDDDRSAAAEWRWGGDVQQMRWMPIE